MSTLEKIPRYKRNRPHKPIFDVDFRHELEKTWGRKWGYNGSPFGKLKMVMVYRPGEEQRAELLSEDLQLFNLPEGPTDLNKLQSQHDEMVRAFEKEGIEVVYLEPKRPLVGTYGIPLRSAPFLRETITVPGGVVICRISVAYKRGLEAFHAQRVGELGCPILYTVHGQGVFEASNLVWIDEKSVILATGLRSNQERFRQVEQLLLGLGIEDIHHAQLPGYLYNRTHQVGPTSGFFHLDMTFGMAADKVAVLYPGGVGYDTIEWLEAKGIDIIEITEEELHVCAPNLLPLAPGKVMVPAPDLNMSKELKKRGISVVEADLTEFAKGGGGPTCLTLPLIRE
jgi:N-dimethylarginine dimethylaminohydrolase